MREAKADGRGEAPVKEEDKVESLLRAEIATLAEIARLFASLDAGARTRVWNWLNSRFFGR